MKNAQTNEPEFLDPRPGFVRLTNAEVDKLRAELHAVMKELKAADQAGTFLSPTARMRLEARRDDLKRQLVDTERKPTGPMATTENAELVALNDREAVERALSNASPAERRAFRSEVEKLGKAVDSLKGDLERAGLVSTATAENVGSDGDGFMPVNPYWED